MVLFHDDVIKWKHFPRYWPFVRGIHRSPVNSLHKGQWRRAFMFSLICVRLSKQSWGWWFETRSLWRHCDVSSADTGFVWDPCLVNTMPADALAPFGARPSAVAVLTKYFSGEFILFSWLLLILFIKFRRSNVASQLGDEFLYFKGFKGISKNWKKKCLVLYFKMEKSQSTLY